MKTPDIIARIEAHTGRKASRSGEGWTALCPSHNDTTPSLTIAEGDDGRTLVCCQRGCTFDIIAGTLQLTPADFYDRDEVTEWDPKRDGYKVTAGHTYTDATGALLFEKQRREPKPGHPARGHAKTFTVRRPDPDKPGRWLYSLGKTERPLYRLSEVGEAIAAGRRVFVVEGEKDADNLAALGFVATCNDGGAGSWQQQHTDALEGARVVLIPDNDATGRAHARAVAEALAGVADSVVVPDLATLADGSPMPRKGDVSDWLASGGTADALKDKVRDAPAYADSPLARVASCESPDPAPRRRRRASAPPRRGW